MKLPGRLLSRNLNAADLWTAIGLGAVGFMLNMTELQLGWGLHFMFGNALVFAFVRVLFPQWFVLAASTSSLRSVFLWHHPWAWLIWTLEAGFVARFANRNASPVGADVVYWLLIGTPLLAISYGLAMDMDRLSLLLVIAKQATNGVLNVVIGELIYLIVLSLKAPGRWSDWPKMPIQSFVMMILLGIILIPTTVFLRIDAPSREQAVKNSVDQALQERLRIADATISMWARSRSLGMRLFAERQLAAGAVPSNRLSGELSKEFSGFSIIGEDGRAIWGHLPDAAIAGRAMQVLQGDDLKRRSDTRLVTFPGTGAQPQLALIVPFEINRSRTAIVAPVRRESLQNALYEGALDGTFLFNAAGALPLFSATPEAVQQAQNIGHTLPASAEKAAVVISDASYGKALMSDLRDARLVRSLALEALPDWRILAVASLSPEVLKAREGQLHLFAALCSFVVLVTLFASLLSKRTEKALRQLAQSAADLALLGTKRDKIDSLVISELNDISRKIASAGSSVSREHGALLNYQRRLNSISQHAPILVYALDISGGEKGELLYVSETITAILGYSRAEATQAGWWAHAIHPEDYDRCVALFRNLRRGRVVHVEYRLRHRLGHYVWVYDTIAVEADPESGTSEAVGVLIDISERKAAAEQLLQADKMASLGRMIAGTAHELNQPLNFIKMAGSNLREHARRGQIDADRFIAKLDSIISHVNRASEIILQMRIFGRTPKELPFPMHVKAAVEAVVAMAAAQLELDDTRVELLEATEGVKVRALPVLLEQVLLNLILNANDAIRTRRNAGDLAAGVIRISIDRHDWRAIVTVDDNGTGLSPEVLPLLFEPFFTTKPPREGTGLGLPISYGIIRDLGGSIRAENFENGARFVVELPIAE